MSQFSDAVGNAFDEGCESSTEVPRCGQRAVQGSSARIAGRLATANEAIRIGK
jgi:hypothetical protein